MTFWEAIARRGSEVTLASGDDTFTFPPPPAQWGAVADWGAVLNLEFDLQIWSSVAANLTNFRIGGAERKPGTIADDTVDSVDTTDNELGITGHTYRGGDGPVTVASTLTLPGGIVAATNYWIGVVDANTIQLYASFNDWLTGADPIDITSAGTGVITLSDVQGSEDPADDTHRVEWFAFDPALGFADDGAIAINPGDAYTRRLQHSPGIVAYALVGTASAAINASIRLVRPQ